MSVPAVSMALKELESALGCRLFERSATGLLLNPQGSCCCHTPTGCWRQSSRYSSYFTPVPVAYVAH